MLPWRELLGQGEDFLVEERVPSWEAVAVPSWEVVRVSQELLAGS